MHAWNSPHNLQAKLIVGSVVKWREFRGNKKMATTLICYARLTQCSKPVKNRKKNVFFFISSFRFLDRFEWLSAEATFQNVASARRVALGQPSLVKISTSAISCLHFFQREAFITMVKKEHRISCSLLWMGRAFWFSKCALNYNIWALLNSISRIYTIPKVSIHFSLSILCLLSSANMIPVLSNWLWWCQA